jgi:hypothetical protein
MGLQGLAIGQVVGKMEKPEIELSGVYKAHRGKANFRIEEYRP